MEEALAQTPKQTEPEMWLQRTSVFNDPRRGHPRRNARFNSERRWTFGVSGTPHGAQLSAPTEAGAEETFRGAVAVAGVSFRLKPIGLQRKDRGDISACHENWVWLVLKILL